MTMQLMSKFGVTVERPSKVCFSAPTGTYKSVEKIKIESDATAASYDLAFIALNGGELTIEGIE